MKRAKQHILRLVASTLLVVLLAVTANNIIFGHFHNIPGYGIVFHAHPYANSTAQGQPFETHSHSDWQLYLYSSVNKIAVLFFAVFLALAMLQSRIVRFFTRDNDNLLKSEYSFALLRAPPLHG